MTLLSTGGFVSSNAAALSAINSDYPAGTVLSRLLSKSVNLRARRFVLLCRPVGWLI